MSDLVTGKLKYLIPSSRRPVYTASVGGSNAKLEMEGEFEEREVQIRNGRACSRSDNSFSLDREGFILVAHQTKVSDFYDEVQVKSIYEDEVKNLLVEATGAYKVVVFDHTLRSDDPATREKRKTREPASVVHNDYTDRSATKRLNEIVPDEAAILVQHRFAIVNVWRPINNPVLTSPLTFCDAASFDSGDLVPTERRAQDRIGELMLVSFNPKHRWFYFPNMQLGEAILLKTYDSATDGRARFSIHTSFETPAPVDAPPRESIETRAFIFFRE